MSVQLVTTALHGLVHDAKGRPTTAFEHLIKVSKESFDTVEGRRSVAIRPSQPLRGNAFSALRDPALRREYLDIGRRAAEGVLGKAGQ